MPTSMILAEAPRVLVLFVYALLFALVEIEIEGAYGWADKLPTWYRVTPRYARAFSFLLSGKPLTGYHAVMFFVPLLSFHLPFVFGAPWTRSMEVRVLAAYLVWVVVWDFLWFVLNPRYGWARFRKGQVWWHDRRWIGRFPIDYWNGFATSLVLVAIAAVLGGGARLVVGHATMSLGLVVLTALTMSLAPAYQRWYAHMRRPGSDERPLVRRD